MRGRCRGLKRAVKRNTVSRPRGFAIKCLSTTPLSSIWKLFVARCRRQGIDSHLAGCGVVVLGPQEITGDAFPKKIDLFAGKDSRDRRFRNRPHDFLTLSFFLLSRAHCQSDLLDPYSYYILPLDLCAVIGGKGLKRFTSLLFFFIAIVFIDSVLLDCSSCTDQTSLQENRPFGAMLQ